FEWALLGPKSRFLTPFRMTARESQAYLTCPSVATSSLPAGTFVNTSSCPDRHEIVSFSTWVALPSRKLTISSDADRKLLPLLSHRVCFAPPTSATSFAPIPLRLLLVPIVRPRSQWLLLAPSLRSRRGLPLFPIMRISRSPSPSMSA